MPWCRCSWAQHFEYGAIDGQRGWYAVKRE